MPSRHQIQAVSALALAGAFALLSLVDRPPSRSEGEAPQRTTPNATLAFEPNVGQTDPSVAFLGRVSGFTVFFTATEVVFRLSAPDGGVDADDGGAVLRLSPVGANERSEIVPEAARTGRSNYFVGAPDRWRTRIPRYGRLRYRDVYPGIDLVFYGMEDGLEYDWVVSPGARPDSIRVRLAGDAGLAIDDEGNLLQKSASGTFVHRAPSLYQRIDGERRAVDGAFRRRAADVVGFTVGDYDDAHELVIDPVIAFSTWLGGNASDTPDGVAVDAAGNVYVAGDTTSADFPLVGALPGQTTLGADRDGFVTKFDRSGAIVYSTYLGGSSSDFGGGVAADELGNAYVVGSTDSNDFPTVNAFQSVLDGSRDAYAAKLDPSGSSLVYSTYLGGSGSENARGAALHGDRTLYVVGETNSADFDLLPTLTACTSFGICPVQSNNAGGDDVFITRFSESGAGLVFSTYLGGTGNDDGESVAVDTAGRAYVAGDTFSSDFPTASAFDPIPKGLLEVFVARVEANGRTLSWSTYLSGSDADEAEGVSVDAAGNAYVTGRTSSSDFPRANALDPTLSPSDAFVTRIRSDGSQLDFSTFLGGSSNDGGNSIAVGPGGLVHVVGNTISADFPTVRALQPSKKGASFRSDSFITTLRDDGSELLFSTFFGGGDSEFSEQIAVAADGTLLVAGATASTDFPLVRPADAIFDTSVFQREAYVVKLVPDLDFFLAGAPGPMAPSAVEAEPGGM